MKNAKSPGRSFMLNCRGFLRNKKQTAAIATVRLHWQLQGESNP